MFRMYEYFRPGVDTNRAAFSHRGVGRALWGAAAAVALAVVGAAVGLYGIFNSLIWLLVGAAVVIASTVGLVVLVIRTYTSYDRQLLERTSARRGMRGSLDMITHRQIARIRPSLRRAVNRAHDQARAIAASPSMRNGLLGDSSLDEDMYDICRLALEIDGLERGTMPVRVGPAEPDPLAERRARFDHRVRAMADAARAVADLDAGRVIGGGAFPAVTSQHTPAMVTAAEKVRLRVEAHRELTDGAPRL